MKKLFVIYNENNNKKEKRKEIFRLNTRIDYENDSQSLKFPENKSNIENTAPITTTNTSDESRKYSLNRLSPEHSTSFNYNESSNSSQKDNEGDKFLGKKIRFQFDTIKQNSEIFENNNITMGDNENILINNENSKNDSFISSGSKSFNDIEEKSTKDKNEFLNRGRWTNKEHAKFIEALVKSRKNWKKMEKCVSTRTSSQIRSHAQKFLLKLKTFKSQKLNLDFSNYQIKNLSDIIRIIKETKENKECDDKNLIDNLITLSEEISVEGMELNKIKRKPRPLKKKFKIEEEKKSIIFNEIKNVTKIVENNSKEICHNININKIILDMTKLEEEKKEIKSNINNDKNKSINKNIFKEPITIKQKEQNSIEENNSYINNCDTNISNKKLIFDDGLGFYLDEDSFFNCNNLSKEIKDYHYYRNFELPPITNKFFFC